MTALALTSGYCLRELELKRLSRVVCTHKQQATSLIPSDASGVLNV